MEIQTNREQEIRDAKKKAPLKRTRAARSIARAAIMAALILVSGMIRIPVGEVPITLQTLAVLVTGILLSPPEAFAATMLHAVIRLILGGGAAAVSPAFGFILSFIVAAPLLSYLTRRTHGRLAPMIFHLLLVSAVIYLIGLPYMYWVINIYLGNQRPVSYVVTFGMLIFIPGDTAKAALACLIGYKLYPRFASAEDKKNASAGETARATTSAVTLAGTTNGCSAASIATNGISSPSVGDETISPSNNRDDAEK